MASRRATLPPAAEDFVLHRGTGHIPDEYDARDFPVAGRAKGGAWEIRPVGNLTPPGVSIPDYCEIPTAKRRDQLLTSECVGFGFARHINARISWLTGKDPDSVVFPSTHAIYNVARRNDPKDSKGNFVSDFGCNPRSGALGLILKGVVDEKRWPFSEKNVNEALPWDVLSAGADAKVLKFHRMTSLEENEPNAFLDEMERLIFSGYTIPFAQKVDRALNDYSSGVLGPITGPTKGSHYTVIKGYDRKLKKVFVDGSWGISYGKDGVFEMSYDRLIQPGACFDFIVLTTLPDIRNLR